MRSRPRELPTGPEIKLEYRVGTENAAGHLYPADLPPADRRALGLQVDDDLALARHLAASIRAAGSTPIIQRRRVTLAAWERLPDEEAGR